MDIPMERQPRPRPCSQVGRNDSTVPKRQSRIVLFLPRSYKTSPKSRNGWHGREIARDAYAGDSGVARWRWRGTTRTWPRGSPSECEVHFVKTGSGQARKAWRVRSGRGLTIWSSAASVASPLQRRVRRPLPHTRKLRASGSLKQQTPVGREGRPMNRGGKARLRGGLLAREG